MSAARVSRSPRPRHGVRLLHTSDLHVGSTLPTPGPAPLDTLEGLVAVARRERVDAVLIAGDFFDHPKVSEDVVARAADAMKVKSVPRRTERKPNGR